MRWSAGWSPMDYMSTTASAAAIHSQATSRLIESVLRFYHLIDDGQYAQAYALCLENKWQIPAEEEASIVGLVTEQEFVQTLNQEIGPQGLGQDIIKIAVTNIEPLTITDPMLSGYPELHTLHFLEASYQVRNIYMVTVNGALLGRCSQWDWEKQLPVAHLESKMGESWRLLLPGKVDERFPHYMAWFTDRVPWNMPRITKIGDRAS